MIVLDNTDNAAELQLLEASGWSLQYVVRTKNPDVTTQDFARWIQNWRAYHRHTGQIFRFSFPTDLDEISPEDAAQELVLFLCQQLKGCKEQ